MTNEHDPLPQAEESWIDSEDESAPEALEPDSVESADLEAEAAAPSELEVAVGRISELEVEVASLTDALADMKDQHLRQAAEYANYRRRTDEQRASWTARAKADVVKDLLPVLDDFDRTRQAASPEEAGPAAHQALVDGVNLVARNLDGVLKKLGVEAIDAAGAEFDEQEHSAVSQAPAPPDTAPGTVLIEVQRGYRLNGEVVRHAQVIVSAEPEPAQADT